MRRVGGVKHNANVSKQLMKQPNITDSKLTRGSREFSLLIFQKFPFLNDRNDTSLAKLGIF